MTSELILSFGITLIAVAVVGAIVSVIAFIHSGKKLKNKLEQEYGDNG